MQFALQTVIAYLLHIQTLLFITAARNCKKQILSFEWLEKKSLIVYTDGPKGSLQQQGALKLAAPKDVLALYYCPAHVIGNALCSLSQGSAWRNVQKAD